MVVWVRVLPEVPTPVTTTKIELLPLLTVWFQDIVVAVPELQLTVLAASNEIGIELSS